MDPRYPRGVPWDQIFFLKDVLLHSYLGLCSKVQEFFGKNLIFEAITPISQPLSPFCLKCHFFANKLFFLLNKSINFSLQTQIFFMRTFLKKKIWSHGTPLGYLGSLSWVQIVECFQNSIGLVLQGLEVTPIPFSAMADFRALRGASGVMCYVIFT